MATRFPVARTDSLGLEALRLEERTVGRPVLTEAFGAERPNTATIRATYGTTLSRLERFDEAEAELEIAYRVPAETTGEESARSRPTDTASCSLRRSPTDTESASRDR